MILNTIQTILQTCLIFTLGFTNPNKGLHFFNNKMLLYNNTIDNFIGSPCSNAIICTSYFKKNIAYKIIPLSRKNINELLFMIDINKTSHKHLPSIINYSLEINPQINKSIILNYMNEWGKKYNRPESYIEPKYNTIFKSNLIIMELPLAKCDVKIFLSKKLNHKIIEHIIYQCVEALNVYHNVTKTIHGDCHLCNFLIYIDKNSKLVCKITDPYLKKRQKITNNYIKRDMQHLLSSFHYIIKKNNNNYLVRFKIIEKEILDNLDNNTNNIKK